MLRTLLRPPKFAPFQRTMVTGAYNSTCGRVCPKVDMDPSKAQTLHVGYGLWYNEGEAMGETTEARDAYG